MSKEEADENEISSIDPRSASLVDIKMTLRCCQRRKIRGGRGLVESDECVVSIAEVIKEDERAEVTSAGTEGSRQSSWENM